MALSAARKVQEYGVEDNPIELPIGTGETVYDGALVAVDATGYLHTGVTATGLRAAGVASLSPGQGSSVTSAANGDYVLRVRRGIFPFKNSSGDAVSQADVGNTVYIEDDETISQTDGGSAQSAAGKLVMFKGGVPYVEIR